MKRINHHPAPAGPSRARRSAPRLVLAATTALTVGVAGIIAPTGAYATTEPLAVSGAPVPVAAQATTEKLNRGLIAIRSDKGNFVSWRLLRSDPAGIAFNVYRGSLKVNPTPITTSTSYLDAGAPADATYSVRPVTGGVELLSAAEPEVVPFATSRDVPLQIPPGGSTPSGESYSYSANDASVGDLDGDGEYEIVLKWDPSNAKDNSQSGYTGNVFIDAYKLNGTRLWRIDLGRNIRAGAHYTQFQVFDYDGDGRAEVAMKTADGTRSGTGQVIGNANADHRNSSGYILAGPEFLTMFNGQNGAVLSTVNYEPARGNVSSWGTTTATGRTGSWPRPRTSTGSGRL
ncbi:hypothetical protein GCM10027615_41820 [Plantactinospora veratri]